MLGWIPLLGNAINASTAFTITEAIGWAIANKFADDVKQERIKLAQEEARRQRKEERVRLEAERARIEAEDIVKETVASPVENAKFQIFSTAEKFFWSAVNFVCCLPVRSWRMTVYVLGGIWRFVRTCLSLLWGLISGKAVQVLKFLVIKIWSGICALASTAFNGLIYSMCAGVVIFALVWVVDKMNLLSPEYLTLFHDLLQLVK